MNAGFFYGLLPELLLLALLVVLMLMETARRDARWARPVFVLGVGAALAMLLQQVATGYAAEPIPGELHVDRFALWAKAVVLACGLAVAAGFPARSPAGAADRGGFKFWLLLAAMLLGAAVVMGSAGFAPLFIGIELLSLPAFALMVMGQGRSVASEGAFKYLLMSSVGTALLLFGISLAYGVSGSLGIAAFVQALQAPGPAGGAAGVAGAAQLQAAAWLMLCGLFLKAAVFPFHAWAPDAYAGTRIEVMAILASVVKVAVVLSLVRIFGGEALGSATIALVAPLAIASIAFGNLAALGQRRFKRLLAYSSVAHAGYMVFALVDTTGSRPADLLWYTAFYAGATVLASACQARLAPEGDDTLAALDGQFHRHPLAALGLAFALLSLAGLPPFPGFFAKLFVFTSVIASGHLLAAVLAFVGSFLGLAVYVGIVLRLFRSESPTTADGRSAPQPLGGA